MGFTIELRRAESMARTGRAAGSRPAPGPLERIVEDGELYATVKRLGSHRLPVLGHLDPYQDTVLRGTAVEAMVREIEQLDLERLQAAEREVLMTLLAWGRRCREDRDLRIAFVGD